MKCALAAVGFINEDIEYNKAVLADTLRKCAGRADVVIFGEAFLQGFYGINFIAKHDTTVSISRDDMIIREICSMAKEYTIAVSFGFIEKENDVFFSSQMTIDKNGQIIDLYRRVSPGWKESFAGKEYCEGDGFHTFHLLGREVAVGSCGDLWYEENITCLNELEPDIVWWPVYTDYNYLEWNNTVKFEYAKQAGKKLPTHKDNISNYRSSSIEKATDSELFRVSGFSLKTRLHSGTIYVYKRNFP